MSFTVTQGVGATPAQVAIGANATTTLTITPTAIGSMLFAVIAIASNDAAATASISSVSDSVNGAWTLIQSTTGTNNPNLPTSTVVAYRDNASSTAVRTVTLTNGSVAGALTWSLGEATHTGTFATDGNALGANGGTTVGTSVTVSGPTPSQANDLAIGVGVNDNGSAWTAPSGGIWSVLWSLTSSGNGTDGRAVIGTNPTSGSSMSTSFTETGGSGVIPSAVVACFKDTSGTSTTITPSAGSGTLTGNAPTVTPATSTVLFPITAKQSPSLVPLPLAA